MPIAHQISPCAKRTVRRLQEAGFEAYVVGGAVRDLLLNREPKDFDIATSATPEEVRAVFGKKCRIIGKRFRLAHVYGEHEVLEVSTFRREPTMEERRGRPGDRGKIVWSDNEYGNLEQDAARRDFTVNALFFDPCAEEDPVRDHVKGLADLKAGIVRTIGDPATRMAEDPVRMLRALKLVAQYNFTIEPALDKTIRNLAPQLSSCSVARLLEELHKILKKPWAEPTLHLAFEYGLMKQLAPALASDWGTPRGDRIRKLLADRDLLLANGEVYPSRVTGFAALVIPLIFDEFADVNDMSSPLWSTFPGFESELRHAIRDYFKPLPLSQFSCAKIRDTLVLLPSLFQPDSVPDLDTHPEYPRARDTFRFLLSACELDLHLFDQLPKPARRNRRRPRAEEDQPRRRRRRGGRGRGPKKKRDGDNKPPNDKPGPTA